MGKFFAGAIGVIVVIGLLYAGKLDDVIISILNTLSSCQAPPQG